MTPGPGHAAGRGRPTLARLAGWLVEAISAFGGVLIVLLMSLIGLDILSRSLFNSPIRGVAEIASLSIIAVVFLQLPQAVRAGRMLRSDGLVSALYRNRPRLGAALEVVNALLLLALLGLILRFGVAPFQQSWRIGEYLGALGSFTAPLWPVRLVMLIGCALCILYLIAVIMAQIRVVIRGPDDGRASE